MLDKVRRTLSIKELRRRARSSSSANASIYKLVAHGESLKLFLWLVGGVSGAVVFIELVNWSVWIAGIAFLLAVWLALGERPINTDGFLWKAAGLLSAPTLKIVDFLHPVLVRLSKFINSLRPMHLHTGLYDKEDLLELLNTQNQQIDNRIAEQDLRIAFGALTFGDKLVREVMVPRREIKIVAASDSIGPLLMDELHKSGFSRFPVVSAPTKEANPKLIGTLYFKDLVDHQSGGKVRDVMKKSVSYIQETQNLRDALNICLNSQHQLLVVVNNFEELAGVISLEDVLEQILSQKIVDESDRSLDLRADAERDAQKEHAQHSKP